MKKMLHLLFLGSFFLTSQNLPKLPSLFAADGKKCKTICRKWEERQDCRYFPDNPNIPPVCTKVKVCVQWEEVCE